MESLVNYESDGNSSDKLHDTKQPTKSSRLFHRRWDSNCENIRMDLSEDSNQSSTSELHPHASRNKNYSDDSKSYNNQQWSNNSDREFQNRDQRRSNHKTSPQRERNGNEDKLIHTDDYSKHRDGDHTSRDKNYRDRDRDRSRHVDNRDRNKYKDKYDRDYDSSRRGDRDRRRYRDDDRSKTYRDRDSYRHHDRSRRRSRSRSRSRSGSRPRDRFYRTDKAAQKRQLLEKLGIELQAVDTSTSGSGETLTGTAIHNSLELPKYYNPGVMNPAKYAQQMQKRKLLWGNKGSNDTKSEELRTRSSETNPACNSSSASTSAGAPAKWTNTRFAQDADGKVASKFMRLMGIKDAAAPPPNVVPTEDVIKKQEEMFSTMEQQYEVARTVTHTMRGMGLGFGRQF
ncbi:arginine/serine-rich coiled-coil protein 2 isoform X2 [Ctenocephalides felis]|uniref:arginine/serine-rich coiled-coil protein 2 isoform X2 n=1 Tax=Ctenocephalides felis TaxID=7515 RepID=UPI000E6E523E|nr:arginine/serine-rich coiled-coil protein 2 isoform X2 [Ctenocephalides felis]